MPIDPATRRPLIPSAPVPVLPPLSRAVRAIIQSGPFDRLALRLSYHASRRIFAMIQGEAIAELARARDVDVDVVLE